MPERHYQIGHFFDSIGQMNYAPLNRLLRDGRVFHYQLRQNTLNVGFYRVFGDSSVYPNLFLRRS